MTMLVTHVENVLRLCGDIFREEGYKLLL